MNIPIKAFINRVEDIVNRTNHIILDNIFVVVPSDVFPSVKANPLPRTVCSVVYI